MHDAPTSFQQVAALVGSLHTLDGMRKRHFRDLPVHTLCRSRVPEGRSEPVDRSVAIAGLAVLLNKFLDWVIR